MQMKVMLPLYALLAACSQQSEDTADPQEATQDMSAAAAGREDDRAKIEVWSDSKATYTDEGSGVLDNGNLWLTTRREGPSGISFAKREIDCAAGTFRYAQEGDTLANMSDVQDAEMAQLTEGSISTLVSDYACRKHGRPGVTGS